LRAREWSPSAEGLTSSRDELGIVGGGADQSLVLGDGFVEIAVRLQEPYHPKPETDLPRAERQGALVDLDRSGAVSRLLVQAAQQPETSEVVRVLVLQLLDE
jgi:hypothetical protein